MTVSNKWKIAIAKTEKPRAIRQNPEYQFWLPDDFAELDYVICVLPSCDCFVIPTEYIVLDAMHISITWPRQRKKAGFSKFHEEWRLISDIPGATIA
jgi:hypothetical protein